VKPQNMARIATRKVARPKRTLDMFFVLCRTINSNNVGRRLGRRRYSNSTRNRGKYTARELPHDPFKEHHAFNFLDVQGYVNVSLTCKKWRDSVNTNHFWSSMGV
jgi:hypothetical protein